MKLAILLTPLDFIFYKFFDWQKSAQPDLPRFNDSNRSFNSILGISILLTMNVMSILKNVTNKDVVYIAPIFLIITYFLYQFKKRYLAVYEKFKKKDNSNLIGSICVVFYVLGSIILFGLKFFN